MPLMVVPQEFIRTFGFVCAWTQKGFPIYPFYTIVCSSFSSLSTNIDIRIYTEALLPYTSIIPGALFHFARGVKGTRLLALRASAHPILRSSLFPCQSHRIIHLIFVFTTSVLRQSLFWLRLISGSETLCYCSNLNVP